jgi:RNA polymerase sigma-70 factor (sigma-E family)
VTSEDEYREFVAARSRELLRFAWMLTYDAGRAEDLLQTSFARLWPHWSRVCRDGDPAAYVRKVMVNTATAWWARRWRAEVPTADVPEVATIDRLDVVDDRDALQRALMALPRRQRAVVVLRYYQGLSEAETADTLGCSVGTVKSQAARALTKLRATEAAAHELRESR